VEIDTGKDTEGVFGPLKMLVVAAVLVGLLTLFGWLFVVSWLGVPWSIGLPMSLLAGLAMLSWSGGGHWRLLSLGLWATGAVWLVVWFLHRYA